MCVVERLLFDYYKLFWTSHYDFLALYYYIKRLEFDSFSLLCPFPYDSTTRLQIERRKKIIFVIKRSISRRNKLLKMVGNNRTFDLVIFHEACHRKLII